jgi:hypothetical protein
MSSKFDPSPFTHTIDERQQQDFVTQSITETHTAVSPIATKGSSVPSPLKTSGVEIMALREHHCRWPLVRAAEERQIYCGKHRTGNMSYCATHAKISYSPSQSRQRNPAAKTSYS